jgi:PPK2 family polyphosphate:nucleotide phosphotransferase
VLAASGKTALLVVLQGRDTAGKDGTIRNVFAACNPQGCRVTAFAAPSSQELRHDYLWRVHAAAPPRGAIGIFNRSHYEDVLAARVRGIVPEAVWSRRFRHIAEFERMLVDEGTTVLKFFLHVSKAEQARRLRKRLERPEKNWKFDAKDLEDRLRWNAYTLAYRDAFRATSTAWAPWYVVPADDKKARNYFVADVIVRALEGMDLRPPELPPEKLESLRTALDAQLAAEEKRE